MERINTLHDLARQGGYIGAFRLLNGSTNKPPMWQAAAMDIAYRGKSSRQADGREALSLKHRMAMSRPAATVATQTLGWQPTCGCNADCQPATVLDPFAGSGTTLAVAQALGRKSVGLDLNPEYLAIAQRYINRADGITLSLGL